MARIKGIEQKYPNLIPVPTSIINLNSAVFSKSIPNSTKIETWSDLKKFNIGIVRGYHFAVVGTQGMNPLMAKNVSHLFTLFNSSDSFSKYNVNRHLS
ncbi:MAG: hypothetical protein QM489_01245 [Candidatus Izemoplasma sp.]